MKKFLCTLLCLLLTLPLTALSVSAKNFVPYLGYEYNQEEESVPAPVVYEPEAHYLGAEIGAGAFSNPTDMCFYGGELYILDSGNSRIVVTDPDLRPLRVIDTLEYNGEALSFAGALGLYVCHDGAILIADTQNHRIIECTNGGEVVQLLGKPDTTMLDESLAYNVKKVIRDYNGITYALVDGVNDGAVTYMPDGSFGGFFASNEVEQTAEVILNYIWRQFMTEEQIRNSVTSSPPSFTNFDLAAKGFVYTVTQSTENVSGVRLLNFKGSNIEQGEDYGDLEWDRKVRDSVSTTFVDIDVDDEDYLYLLDSTRGRVFVYTKEGSLISVFGGLGDAVGTFTSTQAIETYGGKVYVLDNVRGSVTTFTPTEYIQTVRTAQNLHDAGEYREAKQYWEEVLTMNSNSTIAYYGIGLALDEAGEHAEALPYFRLAYSNKGYSDAFSEVRSDFVKANFVWLLLGAAAAIVGIVVLCRVLKRKFSRANAYETSALERKYAAPLFTLFHPIDGFENLKLRKAWSLPLAFGLLTALFLALTASWFLTGFSFNQNRASDYNVFITLLQAYGIAFVWVIANWAVCTLIEGKGRLIDIFGTTVYGLLPFILSLLVCVVLSNGMTQEEDAFLYFIRVLGIVWSGVLIFTGFMSIHQFSFSKAVLSILLTLVGIAIMIFLAVLFVGLMQQVVSFIRSVWSEIVIMM
ncbi:MAG TPA: YIP1 family protein [Firmicutes bacterium]|nr:YIP1 family protein [Bacillota bacterium]